MAIINYPIYKGILGTRRKKYADKIIALSNEIMKDYRKYNSPVYSASKAISLAAACVSVLTLESTMLITFEDGTMDLLTRRIMLGASGGIISVFIIAMAIYMIVRGSNKLKLLKQ